MTTAVETSLLSVFGQIFGAHWQARPLWQRLLEVLSLLFASEL